MTTATAWKEELLSTRKIAKAEHRSLVNKLVAAKHKVAKQIKRLGLEQTWQAKQHANETLANAFYSKWIGTRYPLVDLTFANAKLNLLIQRTLVGVEILGKADRDPVEPFETVISIDRFAKQLDRPGDICNEMPDPDHTLGQFLFSPFQKDRERYRQFSGQIKCNRPAGSPKTLRRKLRDVKALQLEAQAAAVRAGVNLSCPRFGRMFLWEPRIEDIYIREQIPVKDDPAVLVMIGTRAHLVAFWDSPEETPIECLIREFSEGDFDNVVE